jgi:hypothetical protein
MLATTVLAALMLLSPDDNLPTRESYPCAPGPTRTLRDGEASSRVLGVYTASRAKDGSTELCVLVLWRGEVSWHRRRAADLEAIQKRYEATGAAEFSVFPFATYDADLGDIRIFFDYDWEGHRARFADDWIDLGEANVVVIDHVDRVGGDPVVARTLRIPATLEDPLPDVEALVSRHPDIEPFLK